MFAIFDKVGGRDRAIEIIARATGRRPSDFAVAQWKGRRKLPARAAAPLLLECLRLRVAADEADIEWREPEAATAVAAPAPASAEVSP